TPPATLSRARKIALDTGLSYVYVGNVHDPAGQTTTCPGCGTALIVRDWYEIGRYEVTDDGRCRACSARLPGVFAGPVGDWGSRRLPVRVGRAAARRRRAVLPGPPRRSAANRLRAARRRHRAGRRRTGRRLCRAARRLP